jgi:hypothetical protein
MYNIQEIITPDGMFFTLRTDERTEAEIVNDGINGFNNGANSLIYQSLYDHQWCKVSTIFRGLNKTEGQSKLKTLIEYARAKGIFVLNRKH